ncbi:sugar transferase [Streptococcus equinus]|uniref:Bacterial sugar transferase n=1 Tax=Streptococcus equinus ATCC 9812 TaxID=525379 RepID=E8JMU0_STREI|nr:sugar transferase [Streptococcus equinus]EFW89480.1 bacterial sugar transferase [Streptococcus equinus ATCC 9812]SUN56745.1 putative initial sugar transferase WcjG [Streptococcus equinus]
MEGIKRLVFLVVKRIFDIVSGLVGTCVLFLPAAILIFIIYKLQGYSGSIFFKQERLGLNGKKFKIIKFRSMIENAEEVLRSNKVLYRKYVENSYKLAPEEDPRLTTIGAFIRKTSIDELPQFINILKGDMSFIGPRPIIEEEIQEYKGSDKDKFLSVKPGATGYWQVSGRSNVSYPERCDIELYYVDNMSLLLDLKILLNSFAKVISKTGAY